MADEDMIDRGLRRMLPKERAGPSEEEVEEYLG